MKKSVLFLLFACCFCVFPAAAQQAEYTITELELTRLEKISENWQTDIQTLRSQVHSLRALLTEASKTSGELNALLKRERATLKNLRTSFGEFERETAAEIQQKQAQIEKLTGKLYRAKIALVIVSCTLGFLILSGIVFFILKMKIL